MYSLSIWLSLATSFTNFFSSSGWEIKKNISQLGKWSFLQRFYLDNVFFLREKNLSSFLLDVDGFSRVFLLKIFDFRSEPGEFLVFVLSTVSLAHRGRKTKFFSRDVPN